MFLREIIFGTSWADEMDKYFERFRRKKVTIRQFQIDFEKVVVASEYSRDGDIVRTKFCRLLTELEKEFLKKDSLEVMSSEWGLIWEALI